MPSNLNLAVEIADTAADTVQLGDEALRAKAEDLAARHPEADASVEDVAEALRDHELRHA